jgi:hypothetical protein
MCFPGAPFERSYARAVNFKHDFFERVIDDVHADRIDDGEKATGQWWELSNFCRRELREVLLINKLLNLVTGTATIEAIKEGTFIGERYKLQLSEGLILLILVG